MSLFILSAIFYINRRELPFRRLSLHHFTYLLYHFASNWKCFYKNEDYCYHDEDHEVCCSLNYDCLFTMITALWNSWINSYTLHTFFHNLWGHIRDKNYFFFKMIFVYLPNVFSTFVNCQGCFNKNIYYHQL